MARPIKRIKRIPKSRIPKKISEEYRRQLAFKDYFGMLENHEISVAKKAGVLVWDLYMKSKKVAVLTGPLYRKGFRLAPIFDGYGNPRKVRYPGDPQEFKYLIVSYDNLKSKLAGS